MKRLTVILAALALSGPAHAATITNDLGGFLQDYAKRWQAYYQAKEEVRIMGYCGSACTLFLTLPNVCIGRNVQFAFHAPYIEQRDNADVDFQTEYAKAWTMNRYPGWVQTFIMAAGGLSKRTLHMGYAIAGKHMRTCGKPIPPARELTQHQRRVAAWTLQDQRAKELAARRVVEDAQAKIEAILRADPPPFKKDDSRLLSEGL